MTTDTLHFAPALPADEPLMLGFIQGLYEQEGIPYDAGQAAFALRPVLEGRAHAAAWVLRVGEEAVGYLVLSFSYYLEFGPTAILDEVYLTPAWRGSGLGGRAVEFAAAEAKRRGMVRMRLEVERHNPAKGLYERHGFVAHDRDLMTKDL